MDHVPIPPQFNEFPTPTINLVLRRTLTQDQGMFYLVSADSKTG